MTFAELLLEIRRRAEELPVDRQRPAGIERIAREALADIPEGAQAAQVRRILAAFLGLGDGDEFDAALLDQMTPELIFRLDMILLELLDLGRTDEIVRTLRGAARQELCGARTRNGGSCRCRALANGRRSFHGGTSTGPRTPEGRARSLAALFAGLARWRARRQADTTT